MAKANRIQPDKDPKPGNGQLRFETLTVTTVAECLQVSTKTVRRMIESRELPASRVGRQLRVRASDLDAYLKRRRI